MIIWLVVSTTGIVSLLRERIGSGGPSPYARNDVGRFAAGSGNAGAVRWLVCLHPYRAADWARRSIVHPPSPRTKSQVITPPAAQVEDNS